MSEGEHRPRQNGEAIRAIRRTAGRRVSDVAKACGLRPGALTNIECGNRQASWEALNRIARELAVPITALLRDPDRPHPAAEDRKSVV